VLHEDGEEWLCYECRCRKRGISPDEAHHVLGRAVDETTVVLPGNMHRMVSEEQRTLRADVRQAASHDPLALIITVLAAARDFAAALALFVARGLDWLLRAWDRLRELHGDQWWTALGLPGFHPVPTP